MAGLGDILGAGDAVKQLFLWGVLNQVIGGVAGPYLEALTQDINARHPEVVLSPADLAQLVVRNYRDQAAAAAEAARSGVNGERFTDLTHLAGEGPAPGDLATLLRRKVIEEAGAGPEATSFEQGMRESHVLDKWIPAVKALSQIWPTPADALDALLEGQVDEGTGRDLYERFGGAPQYFDLLFHTRGSAPTPLEASEMANRGIIAWDGTGPDATTYQQAFLEGPWRNKWSDSYRQLAQYLPPQSTVITLLEHGAITDATAAAMLSKQGMDDATVAAYIHEAHTEAISDYRGLTISAVADMYYAHMITADDATAILEALHVTPPAAQLLLAYADLRRAIAASNTAVTRIQTLYVGHKISLATARESLHRLDVPAETVDKIIESWQVAAAANVKTLTQGQITSAFKHKVMTQDEAASELTGIGYTPYDAWVLLSDAAGGPLPAKPSRDVAPPQGAVLPGTT
jgi:hypothetical protein